MTPLYETVWDGFTIQVEDAGRVNGQDSYTMRYRFPVGAESRECVYTQPKAFYDSPRSLAHAIEFQQSAAYVRALATRPVPA